MCGGRDQRWKTPRRWEDTQDTEQRLTYVGEEKKENTTEEKWTCSGRLL